MHHDFLGQALPVFSKNAKRYVLAFLNKEF